MSYRDLPPDPRQLPLTDPKAAADVVDHFLQPPSREEGSVALLLCGPDATMITPVVIEQVPEGVAASEIVRLLRPVFDLVAETGGSVLAARGRPGTFLLTDGDRAWHEGIIAVCRSTGVSLLGAYVATPSTVRPLPEPLEFAS